jgi:hypothetical protein
MYDPLDNVVETFFILESEESQLYFSKHPIIYQCQEIPFSRYK